jgi:acetylornithine deacetylase/succinyl-diaminopimelate desuccinylase-like protein
VVLTGFALPDDGYHSPDEHLRVEHLALGVQAAEGILDALADAT